MQKESIRGNKYYTRITISNSKSSGKILKTCFLWPGVQVSFGRKWEEEGGEALGRTGTSKSLKVEDKMGFATTKEKLANC